MSDLLNFLNQNSGALTVIFTGIVTLSTVIYALLTYSLVQETRRMRRAQTEPKVAVYFESRPEWVNSLDIVVKNIGLGPAYNVRFDLSPASDTGVSEKVIKELKEKNFLCKGLGYISPNIEIRSYFTNMVADFDEKVKTMIDVKVTYADAANITYSELYRLDFSELKGLRRLGEPPLYKMANSIKKIEEDINKLSTGWNRLKTDVYLSEDREKEERRLEKQMHDSEIDSSKAEEQK